jgi:hypothetical protein
MINSAGADVPVREADDGLSVALRSCPERWRPPVVAAVRQMWLDGSPEHAVSVLDAVAVALGPILDVHDR